MTRSRLRFGGLVLLLCLCLWGVSSQAQVPALQLCGQTQFTDFVVLGAVILDGPRTIVSADWIQTIPHFYTIAGPLTIIRDPDDIRTFLGLGTVAAKGEPFPSIPSCTVQLTLTPSAVQGELIFAGQAIVTCPVNGSPVVSTLNVTLATCVQPPFPSSGAVTSQSHQSMPEKLTVSADEVDYRREPAFR